MSTSSDKNYEPLKAAIKAACDAYQSVGKVDPILMGELWKHSALLEGSTPSHVRPTAGAYRWIEDAVPKLQALREFLVKDHIGRRPDDPLSPSCEECRKIIAVDDLLGGVPVPQVDLGFDSPADRAARSATATTQDEIAAEVERAVAKFPTWPTDPLHALAVLGEEFGELTKAMLQLTYEPHKTSAEEVREEAIQTAAMALRLVRSLGRYEYRRGEQHEQGVTTDGGVENG